MSILFETVPKTDYLSFFEDKKIQYNRINRFFDFKKSDIAKATQTPLESVRYDARIPKQLKQRITEWATLVNLVADHFDGNVDKTILWFKMPNPLLGNVSPRDMIRFGRYKKLFQFIVQALDENKK